jgi:hypothetical protein
MSRFIYYYAECHYAECRYSECRYAECHYAECRGAPPHPFISVASGLFTLLYWVNNIYNYLTFPAHFLYFLSPPVSGGIQTLDLLNTSRVFNP